MKSWKKILFPILLIFTVPFLIALFSKKDFVVEKEIMIYKPKEEVFNYVKLLQNQMLYSKWFLADSNISTTIKGVDGNVGAVLSWKSKEKNIGKGELEIKQLVSNQRVEFEYRFLTPIENTEKGYIITENESSNITKVKWVFEGDMDYPMNLMLYFMDYEELLGEDMQESLNILKANLEKK